MKTLAQVKKIIKDNEGTGVKVFYYQDGEQWVLEYAFETFKGYKETVYSQDFDDNRTYDTESKAAAQAAKLAKGLGAENEGHLKDLDME